MIPDGPTDNEVRARIECLKIAASSESDPDQAILDAEKFWLFVTGQEQVPEEDEPARG